MHEIGFFTIKRFGMVQRTSEMKSVTKMATISPWVSMNSLRSGVICAGSKNKNNVAPGCSFFTVS